MAKHKSQRFLDFVDSFSPAAPTLPGMHTCFGQTFVQIMDNKIIRPGVIDTTIGKSANFLFYGKPSYRPSGLDGFSNNLRSALFCLVIDCNLVPVSDNTLPFDSGGFDLLSKYCGSSDFTEYYLPSGLTSAGKIVTAIFGNNKNYYKMNVRPGIDSEVSNFDFHTKSLIDMCRSKSTENFDQRAGSIEMHVLSDIHLTKEIVLAVAAPDIACEEDELKDFCTDLSADIIPYKFEFDDINSHQRVLKGAVEDWLVENEFIQS